jgi:hypothetical protein
MARSHLKVREFPQEVTDAARAFFVARPWSNEESQADIAQAFADRVLSLYGLNPVTVAVEPQCEMGNTYEVTASFVNDDVTITLYGFSAINLMTALASIIIEFGPSSVAAEFPNDVNASEWACSLFYNVRPRRFRKLARWGRIRGVAARDTYTTRSWNRLVDAGLTIGNDLHCSYEDAWELLNEPSDSDLEPESTYGNDEPDAQAIADADDAVRLTDGLSACNRDALRRLAAEHNIAGRGTMTRDQLEDALRSGGVTARVAP